MRVASLESVLTAATLVSATVVVLWGIKIFYGARTGRKPASNKRPPGRRGPRQRHRFRGGGGLLFQLPAKRSPAARPYRTRINASQANGEWHGANPPMRPSALHGRGLIRCGSGRKPQ